VSGDDYSQRQKAKDAEYQREYRAWIDSLPTDERRKLEAQGLAEPVVAHHGNGSAKGDAADSPLMRDGDDPAVMPDPDPEPSADTCDIEFVWDAMRRVLGEILTHDNSRLTVECIALASGLAYSGASETEIAKRHGITRAAVSKRCVELKSSVPSTILTRLNCPCDGHTRPHGVPGYEAAQQAGEAL
jgi:hypothetical protein